MIDGYIAANNTAAPHTPLPALDDGSAQPIAETLDLDAAGTTTVIGATGYRFDYGLVRLPVCDEHGFPIQTNGATRYEGLYFIGMPWMPALKTGTLLGVAEAAQQIAFAIAARAILNTAAFA